MSEPKTLTPECTGALFVVGEPIPAGAAIRVGEDLQLYVLPDAPAYICTAGESPAGGLPGMPPPGRKGLRGRRVMACACQETPRCEYHYCGKPSDWTVMRPRWPTKENRTGKPGVPTFMCDACWKYYRNAMAGIVPTFRPSPPPPPPATDQDAIHRSLIRKYLR